MKKKKKKTPEIGFIINPEGLALIVANSALITTCYLKLCSKEVQVTKVRLCVNCQNAKICNSHYSKCVQDTPAH